jgi:mono/diheme cytochrome c family protein
MVLSRAFREGQSTQIPAKFAKQISGQHIMKNMIASLALLCGLANLVQAQEITFTTSQVEEGVSLYQEFCVECHGDRLDNGRFATPIKGAFFENRWQGKSVGELARFTYEEMPEGNGKYLYIEEYIALIAFILSENGFASSEIAMSEDFAELDAISLSF